MAKKNLILLFLVSSLLITGCSRQLEIVLKVDDVLPVNTTEWPVEYITENIVNLNSFAEENGLVLSFGVIPTTIENYSTDSFLLNEIKKNYVYQHGYKHYNELGPPIKEPDIWHEFTDADHGPIPFEIQNEWIKAGKKIIEEKLRTTPTLFVTPQNKYDGNTLLALYKNNLKNTNTNKIDAVVVRPLWMINKENYEERLSEAKKAVDKAIALRKPLVIDFHIQFTDELGIKLLNETISYANEASIRFINLAELNN